MSQLSEAIMNSWLEKQLEDVAKQLSCRYSIGNLIGMGSTSAAFLATSEGGCSLILKIPRDEIVAKEWRTMLENTCNNRERYCADYMGPVQVIRPIELADNYLLEPFATGRPLTYEVYSSLGATEKEHLCLSFSNFLHYAHQQNITKKKLPVTFDRGEISIENSIDLLQQAKAISALEARSFRQLLELFKSRNQDDEVACLVHGDYSATNVIYDILFGTLSILDFGSSCVDCIYRDFVPAFADVSMQVSYQLIADVIRAYNSLGDGDNPIAIEKVALFHYLAAIHESGLIAYCQKMEEEEIRRLVDSFLIPTLNRISEMVETHPPSE